MIIRYDLKNKSDRIDFFFDFILLPFVVLSAVGGAIKYVTKRKK